MSNSSTLFYSLVYITIGVVWVFISNLLGKIGISLETLSLISLAADVVFLAFSFLFFLTLSRKLKQRQQNMKMQLDELTAKNEKLERLAHTQSHNARSPIASILGLTHIFEEDESSAFNNDLVVKIRELCEQTDEKIRLTMAEASGDEDLKKSPTGIIRNINSPHKKRA